LFLPYFSRFYGFIARRLIFWRFGFCAVYVQICGKFRPGLGAKPTLESYLTLLNFKIYRRFCRPLNLKSRADTFKFDFNFNASKAPQER
jgi:hypothetical protein